MNVIGTKFVDANKKSFKILSFKFFQNIGYDRFEHFLSVV